MIISHDTGRDYAIAYSQQTSRVPALLIIGLYVWRAVLLS